MTEKRFVVRYQLSDEKDINYFFRGLSEENE